jgi:TonB family protein
MNHGYRLLLPVAVLGVGPAALLGFAPAASAQLRCDCTQIVDACQAQVSVSGSTVQISSDHRQCSRVDYFIDGQPFVSVAVDGEAHESRSASVGAPRVLVQSCQVCADSAFGAAAQTARPAASQSAGSPPRPSGAASGPLPGSRAGAASNSSTGSAASAGSRSSGAASSSNETQEGGGQLEALIQVQPTYPAAAMARRLTGYVDVEFTVDAEGHVRSASVTKSEPARVFDSAALAAIGRWRYPSEPGRDPVKLTHRFDFRPPADAAAVAGAAGLEAAARAVTTESALPAGGAARNDCVREGAVFDYGDVIEVGLQNTCSQPLIVFGCAVGAGADMGRWHCTDATEQQTLLVPSGDSRLGQSLSLTTDDGVRPLAYKDRFFVSRAPNSEYWWLACSVDDRQCRSSGRLWTRGLDRQLKSVDPQSRSSLALARSH